VKPLLAVDGDSFAHRAYHSMPKSVKRNAVVGFTNMLVGLWEQTEPRAVVVGWDTLEVPTYRHKAFAGYQSGRVFDKSLLEQLDMLPELCGALDFPVGKAPGYEADDFLAAAVAGEETRGGTVIVASGDRDTFQLVSERTTVWQPLRGVSEIARVGPADVRERYGVEPRQVPDFIALRGDPSDKLPGAKGVGPKTAASLLGQYDSLEAMLNDGRFSAQADDLRLFKRIASMDAEAPLPEIPDGEPDWEGGAALVRSWGLNALADRLEGRAQSTS
jgi:DNA polymerase-1